MQETYLDNENICDFDLEQGPQPLVCEQVQGC